MSVNNICNKVKGLYMPTFALMLIATSLFFAPHQAFAAQDILSIVETAGDNTYTLEIVLYEALVLILGGIFLLSAGKEVLPAIFKPDLRKSAEFQQHCYNFGTAIVVVLIFLTLPAWFPALASYFGATGLDFSALG